MGKTVYVLTTLVEKKEWRPVAVVDEMHLDAAHQWYEANKNVNDWVPLELNDMSLTGLGDMPMNFQPEPPKAVDESFQELQGVNARLVRIIQQLAEKHKDKDVLKVLERIPRPKTGARGPENWKEQRENWETFNSIGFKNTLAKHTPNCKFYATGACSCKPCSYCGAKFEAGRVAIFDQPHAENCPAMAQKQLFANKLLRKNDD